MSKHRRRCTAEAPNLLGVSPGHVHHCIHDDDDDYEFVEHECACGTTWQARRPAPETGSPQPSNA